MGGYEAWSALVSIRCILPALLSVTVTQVEDRKTDEQDVESPRGERVICSEQLVNDHSCSQHPLTSECS